MGVGSTRKINEEEEETGKIIAETQEVLDINVYYHHLQWAKRRYHVNHVSLQDDVNNLLLLFFLRGITSFSSIYL